MKRTKLFLISLTAFILAGCFGTNNDYAPLVENGASFKIRSSAAQTVQPGGAANYTISVDDNGGGATQQNVTLSVTGGLPAGATAAFDGNTVGVGGQTTLTIQTGANTPLGTFTITVTGTNNTGTQTTTCTLIVNNPGFSVSIAPPDQQLPNGSGGGAKPRGIINPFADYTFTVTPQPGFTGTVDITITGLENVTPGARIANNVFSSQALPAQLTFNGDGTAQTSTIRITRVQPTPKIGAFPFTVTATSGNISKQASATITLTGGGVQ